MRNGLKMLLLSAVVVMLGQSQVANAKSLLEYVQDVEKVVHPLVQQSNSNSDDNSSSKEKKGVNKWVGFKPFFGYNLLSVWLTDFVNLFAAPSLTSFIFLIYDLINFVLMPVIGGVINLAATYAFENDPITMTNAGINKQDMYVTIMTTLKDLVYTLLGKPDFMTYKPGYVPAKSSQFEQF